MEEEYRFGCGGCSRAIRFSLSPSIGGASMF